MVRQSWELPYEGHPIKIMYDKMKRLKSVMVTWSRATYGDFFKKISTMKDNVRMKETQLELDPSKDNRSQLKKA